MRVRQSVALGAVRARSAEIARPALPTKRHEQPPTIPALGRVSLPKDYNCNSGYAHGTGSTMKMEGPTVSTAQDEAESGTQATPFARIGKFSFNTVAGIWDWDEEVFRIHGLQPWSITPTTEYMLSCKHPDDRARVSEVLDRARRDGRPFSVSHRLIAADGVERRVLMVFDAGVRAGDEAVTSIAGYYIDLTEDFRQENAKAANKAVIESAEHRATIERAVGGLMVAYGLNSEQAFGMLRWWSQNKNVKVRDLASRLVEAASSGAASGLEIRKTFDALLHDLSAQGPQFAVETSPN